MTVTKSVALHKHDALCLKTIISTKPSCAELNRRRFLFVFDEIRCDDFDFFVAVLCQNLVDNRQTQSVLRGAKRGVFAFGENIVASVFFVPIGESGGLVHVLDDLPPADSGVVGAK